MAQTAHNLFFHEIAIQDSTAIDVVVRTTTAAIFGYFISANFKSGKKSTLQNSPQNKGTSEVASSAGSAQPKAKIGFHTEQAADAFQSGYADSDASDAPKPENKAQIIIVATIGTACLVFLLMARNGQAINASSIATLSQLRDFISGSVGFLIGQSTQQKK